MKAAQRKVETGSPLPPERLTLGSHLETWLGEKEKTLRPDTHRRYKDYVKLYLEPIVGSKRLGRLSIEDIQHLHSELAQRGLSGTSQQHVHGVLHAALQDALRWQLVDRNVASLVSAPRRSTAEMKHLGADDARTLLEAAKGTPLGAFFTLALTAGLREGELQALQWRNVDTNRKRVRVTATLNTIKKGIPIFGEPKTQHSRRTVWLSDLAVEALERHRGDQDAARRRASDAWQNYGLVFTNERGLPLWRSQVRRHWVSLLEKAELRPMRIHDLRHSAASLLLSEGVPVKVVSELLGHSDVTTTLRIYAHVIEGAQEQATNTIDRLFHA